MSFAEDGFLGQAALEQSREMRTKFSDYFAHFETINRESHRFLYSAKINTGDRRQFYAAGLFGCSVSTFQAMIVLTERGFARDCQILGRSLLEIHFKLSAIEKDSRTVNRFILDGERLRKKQLEFQLNSTAKLPAIEAVSKEELWLRIKETEDAIARIEAHIANENPDLLNRHKGTIPELKIKFQAALADLTSLHDLLYPHFGDAAHASSLYLESMIIVDNNGEFNGFDYSFDAQKTMMYALSAASLHLQSFEKVAVMLDKPMEAVIEPLKSQHSRLGEQFDELTGAKQRGEQNQ